MDYDTDHLHIVLSLLFVMLQFNMAASPRGSKWNRSLGKAASQSFLMPLNDL
jgi:hypothetical protein